YKSASGANCKKMVTVTKPQPVFACESLSAATVDDDQKLPFNVTFTAAGSASNGAVIQGYSWDFGDGQKTDTSANNIQHGYTKTGEFTATVRVVTNKGTTPVSNKCSVKITVTEVKEPVYSCDALSITKLGTNKYRFAVDYTAENGAVLKNIAYNFGDNTAVLNTLNNPVEHTYAASGEYNASATLTFTVNGQDKVVSSNACKATTDKPPVTPMCPYPGKEHLPKNSPDCKQTTTTTTKTTPTPTAIADTGPGEVIGMTIATIFAGMIAYRMVWMRRYQ
ncbi:PKD domain-containing protein, partial [Candidatus Saccharibacteria bacterium]|nr:PKD domain-containing protein [Candidatus Saccharibacteria bacterium]